MGAIQASLNNLVASTLGATFAIAHLPGVKNRIDTKAKVRALNKKQKLLNKAEAQGKLPNETVSKLREEGLDAAEKALKLDPNKKTYEQFMEQNVNQSVLLPADEDEIAQEQAEQGVVSPTVARAQVSQESKRGVKNAVPARRSFLKAMQAERVSFGGKGESSEFGELPLNLQKQIAAQYSKSERKKVMDAHYGKE